MRSRTRYPRLAAAACRVYRVVIRMYPREFRREFGHELAITFRNRVEDVLNDGGIVSWFAFAAHIAFDGVRTWSRWATAPQPNELASSLLGLRDGYIALGSIDRARAEVTFLAGGFIVACAGYIYFGFLSSTLT